MGANKITYYGKVLIDLTSDTVTPETLAEGITAHDKSGAKITGTMPTNTKTYEITLAKASGWVLLTTLDSEVVEHINDPQLVVSLVKISDNELEKYCGTGGFATNTPIGYSGNYGCYGTTLLITSGTAIQVQPCYYPANNTGTSTSIGGGFIFRLSGGKYYVSIINYFINAGTYRLTFTW